MRIEVLIDVKTVLGEGPLWDVDEQRLYFIDSFGCNVFRCTADGGEVRAWDVPAKIGSMALRRQGGAVLSLATGAADGSTVDAEGCLWNAQVYDGKIIRYTPDGKVERVIDMPVKKVTSVMFGGPNLDILYVTSMAKPPLPRFPGDGVLRGSLFAIHGLGIHGAPEPRFAG